MFTLFSRAKKALQTHPLDTVVSTAQVMEMTPVLEVSDDALPCEKVFHKWTQTPFYNDLGKMLGKPVKKIEKDSISKIKKGHLGLDVPQFDLIDPFSPTPDQAFIEAFVNDMRIGARMIRSEVKALPLGCGLFFGVVSGVLCRDYSGRSGFLEVNGKHKRDEALSEEVRAKYFEAAGNYLFILRCVIPGVIKPADRAKIRAAREVAKQVDGRVLLLVEANWELVTEAAIPRSNDPLILIVKGNDIAYIDRFDCTAAEEHIAREHAVVVKP